MKIDQIEKLYHVNSIFDYILSSADDLIKTHGINVKDIDGYDTLDDSNKLLYEKFIINFINACGLAVRSALKPKSVHYVEETEYLVKENPNDELYSIAGSIIKAINRNGSIYILCDNIHKEYKNQKKIRGLCERYLRFEYRIQGYNTWLHVIGKNNWY